MYINVKTFRGSSQSHLYFFIFIWSSPGELQHCVIVSKFFSLDQLWLNSESDPHSVHCTLDLVPPLRYTLKITIWSPSRNWLSQSYCWQLVLQAWYTILYLLSNYKLSYHVNALDISETEIRMFKCGTCYIC